MKRLSVVMATLASFFSSCSGQQQPAVQDNPNTLLWQISGNGLKKPSYFFGTMHLLCSDDAVVSKELNQVINQVQQAYFEIDMDDMVQMFGGMGSMQMANGKKLKDLYTEADYEKIKNWFTQNGQLPFMLTENFKPMLLSSLVSEQAIDCPQKDGMEFRILDLANKKKMEIKGLETVAFQSGILDSIPYEEQAKELLAAIDSAAIAKKEMQHLIRAYKSQNLDSINALTNSEESGLNKYLDLMLYSRNRNWAAQFDAIAQQKSTLFAVGAGHLPGAEGVLNLLRKKGYTVLPIKNTMASQQ